MKRTIQVIVNKCLLLAGQLTQLCKKLLAQLKFPTLHHKGNLLSTVFILFIDLTVLLIQFPWDLSINFLKRWKQYNRYNTLCRKGILITGFFLFFISSYEWVYSAPRDRTESCTSVQNRISAYQPGKRQLSTAYHRTSYAPLALPLQFVGALECNPCDLPGFYTIPLFILHRNFRI